MLEKTVESPLDSKETGSLNPKGHQPRKFTGRTDAEAEAPIIWPPDDVKSQLIGKDPDARKGWGYEKRATETYVVGWHHQIKRHVFGQTLGNNGTFSWWGHQSWTQLRGWKTTPVGWWRSYQPEKIRFLWGWNCRFIS